SSLCNMQVDIAHQVDWTGQPVAFGYEHTSTARCMRCFDSAMDSSRILERIVSFHLLGTVISDIKGRIWKGGAIELGNLKGCIDGGNLMGNLLFLSPSLRG